MKYLLCLLISIESVDHIQRLIICNENNKECITRDYMTLDGMDKDTKLISITDSLIKRWCK